MCFSVLQPALKLSFTRRDSTPNYNQLCVSHRQNLCLLTGWWTFSHSKAAGGSVSCWACSHTFLQFHYSICHAGIFSHICPSVCIHVCRLVWVDTACVSRVCWFVCMHVRSLWHLQCVWILLDSVHILSWYCCCLGCDTTQKVLRLS